MSFTKQPTIKEDNETIDVWIINANGQEWRLSATRYQDNDGNMSKPYWGMRQLTGNISVTLLGHFDDHKPRVGINWPAQGDQPLDKAMEFNKDICSAIEAAQSAQNIIDNTEA